MNWIILLGALSLIWISRKNLSQFFQKNVIAVVAISSLTGFVNPLMLMGIGYPLKVIFAQKKWSKWFEHLLFAGIFLFGIETLIRHSMLLRSDMMVFSVLFYLSDSRFFPMLTFLVLGAMLNWFESVRSVFYVLVFALFCGQLMSLPVALSLIMSEILVTHWQQHRGQIRALYFGFLINIIMWFSIHEFVLFVKSVTENLVLQISFGAVIFAGVQWIFRFKAVKSRS